jgi:hypothetical protein
MGTLLLDVPVGRRAMLRVPLVIAPAGMEVSPEPLVLDPAAVRRPWESTVKVGICPEVG